MCRAMNRSALNVLFGAFGKIQKEEPGSALGGVDAKGTVRSIVPEEVGVLLDSARSVIVVPGYGMAVAQAQYAVSDLAKMLMKRGIDVKYAIHPVAGRMPGHMNVLLAEAGVPYEHLLDRDEANPEFASTDVVLVIGANDVVNPAARRAGSPLQGMPILDVDQAKNVVVLKRGQGKGFAGIENDLFYKDNARMLYGDAQATVGRLVQALKKT
jgi:H+-translocating NAD(P) transhydrogenase subunit beta